MKQLIHRTAALIATLCIALFFVSSISVELFGTHAAIATVKGLIVYPGLFVLVPAIAITGATGFSFSKSRSGPFLDAKKKRMPIIAANGLLILLPAAIYLDRLAETGAFDTSFYLVQSLELFAGGVNLLLMTLNIRDGLRLAGRFKPAKN